MHAPNTWEIERPGAGSVEAFGIQQVLRFFFSNILLLAGGLAIGLTIGLVLQKITPTAYESKGKFVIDELPFSKQGSATTDAETERQLVQTLILSIASRDMAIAVAEQLNIGRERLSFDGIDLPLKLTKSEPQANIDVTATKESRIGVVMATSQSPEFAATTVNAILDQLNLYNQIGGRLKQINFDLNLARTKADNILTQILAVSEKRIDLEQQTAELAAYSARKMPIESFQSFATDPTLNNLKTQLILVNSEYDSIAATNTKGPRLTGKRSELEGLRAQIIAHAQSLASALKSELEILVTRERDIQSELNKTQTHIQKLNDASARLTQSFGNPVQMRRIADEKTFVASVGNVVVVIDRGVPNPKPARPKLALNLALGLVLGGMLGFAAAALRTLLDSRLHTPEAVLQKTGQPCLALLPPLDPIEKRENIFDRPRSPIGLGYLRSHFLRTAMEGEARKIIGFTAVRKNGDVSRLVAGLAILLAQAERRTLVIDLYRKQPRIAPMLSVKDGGGLTKWLSSNATFKSCIGHTTIPELGVIGFDKATRDLDDLLGRRPLAMELPTLLDEWDFILIASPAIRFDWTLMLAMPSGSPLVIAGDYSSARAVDVINTVQRAQNTRWFVEGVVLQNCPKRAAGTRSL